MRFLQTLFGTGTGAPKARNGAPKKTDIDTFAMRISQAIAAEDSLDGVVAGISALSSGRTVVDALKKKCTGNASSAGQQVLKASALLHQETQRLLDPQALRKDFYITICESVSETGIKMGLGFQNVPRPIAAWKKMKVRAGNDIIDGYGIVVVKAKEFRERLTQIRDIARQIQEVLRQ